MRRNRDSACRMLGRERLRSPCREMRPLQRFWGTRRRATATTVSRMRRFVIPSHELRDPQSLICQNSSVFTLPAIHSPRQTRTNCPFTPRTASNHIKHRPYRPNHHQTPLTKLLRLVLGARKISFSKKSESGVEVTLPLRTRRGVG